MLNKHVINNNLINSMLRFWRNNKRLFYTVNNEISTSHNKSSVLTLFYESLWQGQAHNKFNHIKKLNYASSTFNLSNSQKVIALFFF